MNRLLVMGTSVCACLAYEFPEPGVTTSTGDESGGSEETGAELPTHVAAEVATGVAHSCARDVDGDVWCWGGMKNAPSGSGPDAEYGVPDRVELGEPVVSLSAGIGHTCALGESGRGYCWGNGYWGQLGDASTDVRGEPGTVAEDDGPWVSLHAGGENTCAVNEAGEVFCWGSNRWGVLGPVMVVAVNVPMRVQGLVGPVLSVRVGNECACAVDADDVEQCWGAEPCSLSGDSVYLSGGENFQLFGHESNSAFGGRGHLCEIDDGGTLRCHGCNRYGQLGDGSTTDRDVPVEVVGLDQVISASGVWGHSCAVDALGVTYCWGIGGGVLGHGDEVKTVHVPQRVLWPG